MNVERLVAFHADKVVPVSLMVPKEKVLAMRRLGDIPPIRQALLHRAQCRMLVQLIINIIGLQEAQHFAPQPATFQFIDFHLRFCFGCKFRQFSVMGTRTQKRRTWIPRISESFAGLTPWGYDCQIMIIYVQAEHRLGTRPIGMSSEE